MREEIILRNYCYKVIKRNGWRSQDKIDTIEGVDLTELDRTCKSNELCSRGIMCEVYEEGSYYEEYDSFYFQAENAINALGVGYAHYIKRDLEKQGKYNIFLFYSDKSISFDKAMSLSNKEAYEEWCACL